MKLIYLSALVALSSVALAQQPRDGFGRKKKTERPIDNLSRRIGADEIPLPAQRTGKQSIIGGQAAQSGLQSLRLRVVRDEVTGLPVYIENRLLKASPSARTASGPVQPVTGQARVAAVGATYQFLNQVREVLKIDQPEAVFSIRQAESDALGQTHVRLTQTYQGIPVYGAELVAHLIGDEVSLVNGHYQTVSEDVKTQPKLSVKQAADRALADIGTEKTIRTFGSNLFNLEQAKGDLCLFPVDGTHRLAYELTVRPGMIQRWSYIIDAETGAVLDKANTTCSLAGPIKATARDLNGVSRSISTYQQATGKYFMIDASRPMFNSATSTIPDKTVGGLVTVDSRNTYGNDQKFWYVSSANNTDWTPTAVSAHYNAGIAYDYYRTTHGRNSLNGKGGTITSVVNVADEDDGTAMDNAYWNGEFIAYGNGKTFYKPLGGSLDVAGHEMTHGVIENSANLVYKSQSGAINESMADVFGAMIDRDDWTIGEDIIKSTRYTQGALRSMSNPNQGGKNDLGWQPKTMAEYQQMPEDEENDNGGVHVNSGICNHAYYLFATSVTKEKAEKVYYRALTTYLTRTSKFLDLRLAVVKAATDLYGASSAEVTAAKSAFDRVGIVESTQTTPDPKTDVPVAQGQDLMLIYGSDSKLYSTVVGSGKFDLKSSTGMTHRPSVTDDGKFAYYVSPDKRIRAVSLTGTPTETVVSNETRWDNVAISKDGTKLAALSSSAEPKIYVYSFDKKVWKTFTLYNPTYTEGVTSGAVQYADSFEWDLTGEYLVYDAYNEVTNAEGNDLSYWDVGFIKVWDNKTKDFGKGEIEKLFSNLEEGESVGNPSYAKNSTNIIAFDYFYEADDEYYVVAADVDKGQLKGVYENNTLGFPSYSRLDNRLVFTIENSSGGENVAGINLGADKISPSGSAQAIVTNAKWPVWYTQSARTLPNRTAQTITFNPIADRFVNQGDLTLSATSSAGLAVQYSVRSGPAELSGNKLKIIGPGTVTIRAYQDGNSQYYAATPVDRSFTVLAVLGLEPDWADAVKLYPNPASDQVMVEVPVSVVIKQLRLSSANGSVVRQQPIRTRNHSAMVPVGDLPKGVYVLTIQTEKGVVSRKLMKE